MTQTEENLIMKYCTFWNNAINRAEFPTDNVPVMLKEYSNQQNEQLKEGIREAIIQIEYLHGKFKPTGTGEAVLAQLKALL